MFAAFGARHRARIRYAFGISHRPHAAALCSHAHAADV
jgi:hypothetical protein